MKLLFLTLILLLAAIYVGSISLDDPGFIIIGYHDSVLRTSFIFFALAVILAGILLYFIVRLIANLFAAPKKVGNWNADRKEKKAQKSLSRGFAALAEGDWINAEKSLSHDAKISNRLSYIHYLGAARAAQNQGRVEQRDDYLQLAHSSAPEVDVAVGITRAELQIEDQQYEMARITLEELLANHPNQPRILQLLAEIYADNQDWESLQSLFKRLKKTKAVSAEQLLDLEHQAWVGLLNASDGDLTHMQQTWKNMPKALKEDAEISQVYIENLCRSDDSSEAIALIEKSLSKQWDHRLVTLYGEATSKNPTRQLEHAKKWLSAHNDDHYLLTMLGTLCSKEQAWDQAKDYLQQAIDMGAGPEVYRQLAEVLEKTGDTQEASEFCKKGLFLATDKTQQIALIKPA